MGLSELILSWSVTQPLEYRFQIGGNGSSGSQLVVKESIELDTSFPLIYIYVIVHSCCDTIS